MLREEQVTYSISEIDCINQDRSSSAISEALLIKEYCIIQNESDFKHKNKLVKNRFLSWFKSSRQNWQEQPDRLVQTNVPDTEVIDNAVHTAKYNLLSFIPLNIMEQFSKLPNVYFLVKRKLVGFLQMVHEISNSEGKPVIFIPLCIILCVTALKDAYEDLKRHMQDKQENNKQVLVCANKNFIQQQWRNLRIGHLVKVLRDEPIPADLILIYSSNPGGSCYVETKNLDGETNLKVKQVPNKLQQLFTTISKVINSFSVIRYEKPNPFLYKFQGSIEYQDDMKMCKASLDIKNFLLRGCTLKQTEYIIGVVAYSGGDTKIMLNSVKSRPKLSTIQVLMNQEIIFVFFVQIILCLICAYLEQEWQISNYPLIKDYFKLDDDHLALFDSYEGFLINYGMWMMLFTNFVPISLLVTLDMVKFFQSIKIPQDKHMISKDNTEAQAQSSCLNEELGQVGFIFTDKTGTLTCNQLVFKAFGLLDKVYGLEECQNQDEFYDEVFDREMKTKKKLSNSGKKPNAASAVNSEDDILTIIKMNCLQQQMWELSEFEKLEELLIFFAVCHEIIVERKKDGRMVYNACSPDDLCLVEFAKKQGYELIGMDEKMILSIRKKLRGEDPIILQYQILHILPFSSARKRMSVLYKKIKDSQTDEKIYILTKGADSVVMERLNNQQQDKFVLEKIQENLDEFAKLGYRTLVLAKGRVTPSFFEDWEKRFIEAQNLLSKEVISWFPLTKRDSMVENISSEIENNLILFACTAIEDKLQENVGHTINMLRAAGIQIWMLTGDKRETAVNVGLLSQIIQPSFKRITLDFDSDNYEQILSILKQAKKKIVELGEDRKIGLIVSGDSMDSMTHQKTEQQSQELLTLFMKLARHSDSVIVYRVSPKQKRQIVDLFRIQNPKATTLAIGDGANDVNMIIGAHVGIGIRGLEGQQAARASDFSIGEFQHLGRLLLYYGREFYRKNSNLVLYNFYKNILLVMPQFWYGFYNGFSGQFMYDMWIFQLYNIIFTSAPVVLFALFDKEYKGKFLLNNPSKYIHGLLNTNFNPSAFWQWFILGVVQAALIGVTCVYIIDQSFEGYDTYMILVGNYMYSNIIILSNIKILLFATSISPLLLFFTFGSIASYYVIFFFLSQFSFLDNYQVFERLYLSVEVWFGHIFIIGTCFLIETVWVYWRYLLLKQDQEKVNYEIPYQKLKLSIIMPSNTPKAVEMGEMRNSKISQVSNQLQDANNETSNKPEKSQRKGNWVRSSSIIFTVNQKTKPPVDNTIV